MVEDEVGTFLKRSNFSRNFEQLMDRAILQCNIKEYFTLKCQKSMQTVHNFSKE